MQHFRRWSTAWFGCLLGCHFFCAAEPGTAPVGAALLKTDILLVLAHPDDETGAVSTIAQYALNRNARISAVYCTRGEGGGNAVGTQFGPALGILREAELREALAKLGVRSAYFLDAEDFAYTEDLRISLERWDHLERLKRLVRLVRALQPEVILTQDPAPRPGQHGNHQAAGVMALEAFDAAADPQRFPEQWTHEGLTLWRPRKLYWSGPAGTGATISGPELLADGRPIAGVIASALASHRSQGFGRFTPSPWMWAPQSWTLVKSVVPFSTVETNFFRGLPVAEDAPDRLLAPGDDTPPQGLNLRFRARSAVEDYLQVCQEQRIQHATQLFAADIPVVAGEASPVNLWVQNPESRGLNAEIHLSAPTGWELATNLHMRFSPSRTNLNTFWVTAPAGKLADENLDLLARVEGRELRTSVRLHPVPHLIIPHTQAPLPFDAVDANAAWSALPAQTIAFTHVWEGKVRDAADSSAVFRVAHDATNFYFEIRVRDDSVVSNLSPSDIRGHWRTDSVELCIDPHPGSSHTLGCFKLGIVPFDSTGHVGGARDADANPGPAHETCPGTRLISWKTDDGYAVRASIPRMEAGIPDGDQTRIGFNVLVYDADQTGAAIGDNLNKSRIAWSPRSGVQGRPEDWGRADLH